MNPAETRIVESILGETLSNAAQAPFYRRAWSSRWKGIRALRQLSQLPLLDKATASAHQADLIVGERPPGIGVFSSGTTRGEAYHDPLHLYVTPLEHDIRAKTAPRGNDAPAEGWSLWVVSVHHGLPGVEAGPNSLRLPWLHDANALAMLELTLRAPQPDGRRVTSLVIGSGPLKVLTTYLLERGATPSTFGVRGIGTFSYRLSSHWHALVENTFGATVFDNYSLSEIATPFTRCLGCGSLHMGHPPVAWELVGLRDDAPIKKGPGRLVMTMLYPFTSKMPLIRYDTGDVAMELGTCEATNQTRLEVLGRAKHGLITADAKSFVLNPVDVRDVLEQFHESEKTLHPMVKLGTLKSPDLGPPRWSVAWQGEAAALRFEVRFDPTVYPKRARELESEVLERICARDPMTKRLLKKKHVTAQAVGPGRLTALTERYD